jgi:hypothetical protein
VTKTGTAKRGNIAKLEPFDRHTRTQSNDEIAILLYAQFYYTYIRHTIILKDLRVHGFEVRSYEYIAPRSMWPETHHPNRTEPGGASSEPTCHSATHNNTRTRIDIKLSKSKLQTCICISHIHDTYSNTRTV